MSSSDRRSRRSDLLNNLSAKPVPRSSLSPSREGSPQGSASKGRQSQLVKVFAEFDLDDSGEIESKALLALGQARRSLGQKGGVWDESKNAKLVKNMDSSGDGLVDEKEFARYFDSKLPADAEEFSAIMEQFMEVARACRIKKVEQRKASGGSSSGTRGQGGSVSKRSSDFEKLEADMLVEADQNRSGNNSAGGSSSSSAKVTGWACLHSRFCTLAHCTVTSKRPVR